MIYTDRKLKALPTLVKLIKKENERQLAKWGVDDATPFEWLTYLTEEVGVLAEAISDCEYCREGIFIARAHIVTEAIQVATLALKIAEMHLPSKPTIL